MYVGAYTPAQRVGRKVEKSSKIGQGQKTLAFGLCNF